MKRRSNILKRLSRVFSNRGLLSGARVTALRFVLFAECYDHHICFSVSNYIPFFALYFNVIARPFQIAVVVPYEAHAIRLRAVLLQHKLRVTVGLPAQIIGASSFSLFIMLAMVDRCQSMLPDPLVRFNVHIIYSVRVNGAFFFLNTQLSNYPSHSALWYSIHPAQTLCFALFLSQRSVLGFANQNDCTSCRVPKI